MRKPKILVVDDDPDLVKALRLRLRANNCDVITAADGYSVIAAAQKVNVVRRHQSHPEVPRNPGQHAIAFVLRVDAVVVQFHEEIFRAENVAILRRALFRFFNVVRLNGAVDFARKTTAQSNQPR